LTVYVVAGLEKVATGCLKLTSLDLSECGNVTDAGLEKVTAGFPNLMDVTPVRGRPPISCLLLFIF
jgi:hypothetical protein